MAGPHLRGARAWGARVRKTTVSRTNISDQTEPDVARSLVPRSGAHVSNGSKPLDHNCWAAACLVGGKMLDKVIFKTTKDSG